jgi:hypothetical protein
MAHLDDLPIDPAREHALAGGTPPAGPAWARLALVALAVVVLGGLGWFVWQRTRPSPAAPASAATALPEAAAPPKAAVMLPPLEAMDPYVRTLLSGLSQHPLLLKWLATDDLVGGMATAIDQLAQGQSPARDLAVLKPQAGFTARPAGDAFVLAPASAARYSPMVDAVTSIEPKWLAEAYLTLEPRIAEAYTAQGHPGHVRDALRRAVATLTATPDVTGEIRLMKSGSGYVFADPALQSLPPAQRHLLRMGPEQAARVREAVRAFGAAVAAGSEPATPR